MQSREIPGIQDDGGYCGRLASMAGSDLPGETLRPYGCCHTNCQQRVPTSDEKVLIIRRYFRKVEVYSLV